MKKRLSFMLKIILFLLLIMQSALPLFAYATVLKTETALPVIEKISLGNFHSVALASDGTVYTWGSNEYGQLGDGNIGWGMEQVSPIAISMPGGVTIEQVSAGGFHTIALASDGTVYTWGYNEYGQLGDGNSGEGTNQSSPTAIQMPRGVKFEQVSAGFDHTVALASDGRVYTWGGNAFGQLGDGNIGWGVDQSSPTAITIPGGAKIEQVSAGGDHTIALASDGTIYTWGRNNDGQLGDGNSGWGVDQSSPTVIPIPGGAKIEQISAGFAHTIALASDGTVYTWGRNNDGQLGGDNSGWGVDQSSPTVILISGGAKIEQVSAGGAHTVALASDETVYTWGSNEYGQLGYEAVANQVSPTAIPLPGGATIEQVSVGGDHTITLASDGTVYTWGKNSFGQLGDGSKTDQASPQKVLFSEYASKLETKISTSQALHDDSKEGNYRIGSKATFQTAIDTARSVLDDASNRTQADLSAAVSTLETVISIFESEKIGAGDKNALETKIIAAQSLHDDSKEGKSVGEYGIGSKATFQTAIDTAQAVFDDASNRTIAGVDAAILTLETAISTFESEIIRVDKSALETKISTAQVLHDDSKEGKSVGEYRIGSRVILQTEIDTAQSVLDDASNRTQEEVDTAVSTLEIAISIFESEKIGSRKKLPDIEKISLGFAHTVALASDGTVYTWGLNNSGQLGDGSLTNQSSPKAIQMPKGAKIEQVSAGSDHTVALASDGTVYTWGENTFGQLGNGDSGSGVEQVSPIAISIPGAASIEQVAAGGDHTIALASDGTLYTWGCNFDGQLGDGDSGEGTNQASPIAIQIPKGAKIKQVSAGSDHTIALASDGTLYTWGDNEFGQLGDGNNGLKAIQPSPTAISIPEGASIKQIKSGGDHTIALTSDGTLYTWGRNEYGQLGNGRSGWGFFESSPTAIQMPRGAKIEQITVGEEHTIALASDGTVYTWGLNDFGQLGNGNSGDFIRQANPTAIHMPILKGVSIEQVSVGGIHTAALASDGTLYTWGSNDYGQLGNGIMVPSQATPQKVLFSN
ncbi:FIVAR domain-containing protein [Bacillus solimangrovi]|uniref:RCC1 domain-containing protein n=1 Tax=Bacillus solimangrovi TaxID=1305675 RepID=UPI001586D964|nr:FIVAR domain-containing protein [Bacillus solimangrovi]